MNRHRSPGSLGGRPSSSKLPMRTPSNTTGKPQLRRSRSLIRSNSNLYSKSQRSMSQTPNSLRVPRGSVGMSIERKPKQADPRPLTDKTWQANEALKIETFLKEIGANSCLNSGQKLRPLTIANFVQIANILLEPLFEPNILTTANYVEKFPVMMNLLKYPSTIAASTLKTAYSLHSWPSILAALSFLVNLQESLKTNEGMESFENSNSEIKDFDDIESKIQKARNNYIRKMFFAFNGVGEEPGDYGEELSQIFGFEGNSEEVAESLTRRFAKIQLEREKIENEWRRIDEKLKERKLKRDILRNKLDEKKANLEAKIYRKKNIKQEIKAKREKLEKLKSESDLLMKKLDNSGKNEDLRKLQSELKDLHSELDESKTVKASLDEKILKLKDLSDNYDVKLTKLKTKLNTKVKENNSKICEYALKYPELEDWTLPALDMKTHDKESLKDVYEKRKALLQNCVEAKAKLKAEKIRLTSDLQNAKEIQTITDAKYLDLEKICNSQKREIQEQELSNKEKETKLIEELKKLESDFNLKKQNLAEKEKKIESTSAELNEKCQTLNKLEEAHAAQVKKQMGTLQTLQRMYYEQKNEQMKILQRYVDLEERDLEELSKHTKGKSDKKK